MDERRASWQHHELQICSIDTKPQVERTRKQPDWYCGSWDFLLANLTQKAIVGSRSNAARYVADTKTKTKHLNIQHREPQETPLRTTSREIPTVREAPMLNNMINVGSMQIFASMLGYSRDSCHSPPVFSSLPTATPLPWFLRILLLVFCSFPTLYLFPVCNCLAQQFLKPLY